MGMSTDCRRLLQERPLGRGMRRFWRTEVTVCAVLAGGAIFVLFCWGVLIARAEQQLEERTAAMDERHQGKNGTACGKSVKPEHKSDEEWTGVPEDQPVKTIPIGTPASKEELERLKREAEKLSVPPKEGAKKDTEK